MGRTVKRAASGDPFLALGLLLVGLVSLCLAVFYPLQSLLAQSSPLELMSSTVLVISADTFVIVAGCLVVTAVTTTLGLLLLFLRL